jgi:preprotein translocase subunit Sec61beta
LRVDAIRVAIGVFKLRDKLVWSFVIAVSNWNWVLEHVVSILSVIFNDVGSKVVNCSAALNVSSIARKKSQRLVATAAAGVGLSFFEERKADSVDLTAHITVAALNFWYAVGIFAN